MITKKKVMTKKKDKGYLRPCPFCGSPVALEEFKEYGSGEYRGRLDVAVLCRVCWARGPFVNMRFFRELSKYSVEDFRENPSLRAKEDDAYEEYRRQIHEFTANLWNGSKLQGPTSFNHRSMKDYYQ